MSPKEQWVIQLGMLYGHFKEQKQYVNWWMFRVFSVRFSSSLYVPKM
jgi:hypothetical protein